MIDSALRKKIVTRVNRLMRLDALNAPQIIIHNEIQMCIKALQSIPVDPVTLEHIKDMDETTDWILKEENQGKHLLFKTGDYFAPDQIKDRNGEVVLSQCRICNKAESELGNKCNFFDEELL